MLFTTNTVHCVGGSEFFNVCESKENLLRYIIGGYVMNRRSVQSGCVFFPRRCWERVKDIRYWLYMVKILLGNLFTIVNIGMDHQFPTESHSSSLVA